jgi:hypothetical protein
VQSGDAIARLYGSRRRSLSRGRGRAAAAHQHQRQEHHGGGPYVGADHPVGGERKKYIYFSLFILVTIIKFK